MICAHHCRVRDLTSCTPRPYCRHAVRRTADLDPGFDPARAMMGQLNAIPTTMGIVASSSPARGSLGWQLANSESRRVAIAMDHRCRVCYVQCVLCFCLLQIDIFCIFFLAIASFCCFVIHITIFCFCWWAARRFLLWLSQLPQHHVCWCASQ